MSIFVKATGNGESKWRLISSSKLNCPIFPTRNLEVKIVQNAISKILLEVGATKLVGTGQRKERSTLSRQNNCWLEPILFYFAKIWVGANGLN